MELAISIGVLWFSGCMVGAGLWMIIGPRIARDTPKAYEDEEWHQPHIN
jgi:hypothetical protein